MGKVVEKVKLTSLFEPEKSLEVEAVIDTGATMVVLPMDIVEELGLRKMREVKVRYANNKVETKPIYGVNIELKGRSANPRSGLCIPAYRYTPLVALQIKQVN